MKLLRRYRILLLIVGGLFVLWLIYYAGISVIYGFKLRSLRAQVKAEGSSLNIADLAPKPVPKAENAARWYKAAGLVICQLDVGRGSDDTRDTAAAAYDAFLSAKPEEKAKVVAERRADLNLWLDRNKLALQLLHEGAKRDRGYSEVEYADGATMRLPHLSELRNSGHLLSLEARLSAADGDSSRALQSVWVVLRLRRALESEPILISYLVGIATDGKALRTLQEIMPVIRPQENDLRQILADLQSRDPKNFRRVAEGERALITMLFESARKNGIKHVLRDEIGGASHMIGLESALVRVLNGLPPDEALSLSWMNRFVEAASRVDSLSPDELRHWDVEEVAVLRHAVFFPGSRYFHMLSGMVLPALGRALIEAKKDIARNAVAQCGIAAELYRLDHGAYPANLDALTPKYLATLPHDTFSGKSLLFKSLPNGILIHSIGPNGKDDGGEGVPPYSPQRQLAPPDDVVWRMERPSPAQPDSK